MRGICTLGVDGSYYNLLFFSQIVMLFQEYLGADHFVIVKDLPGSLSVNVLLLEDNCAFAVVLILIVLHYIVHFIFRVNNQGV